MFTTYEKDLCVCWGEVIKMPGRDDNPESTQSVS